MYGVYDNYNYMYIICRLTQTTEIFVEIAVIVISVLLSIFFVQWDSNYTVKCIKNNDIYTPSNCVIIYIYLYCVNY